LGSSQKAVGILSQLCNASATFSTPSNLANLALTQRDQGYFSGNEKGGQQDKASYQS
jgi:hypothetical protein